MARFGSKRNAHQLSSELTRLQKRLLLRKANSWDGARPLTVGEEIVYSKHRYIDMGFDAAPSFPCTGRSAGAEGVTLRIHALENLAWREVVLGDLSDQANQFVHRSTL